MKEPKKKEKWPVKISLDKEIMNFDGKPIKEPNGKFVTMKDLLTDYLAFFQSPQGSELIAASVLGHKVFKTDGEMELEKGEMALIRKATSVPRHIAVVYAAMMDELGIEP